MTASAPVTVDVLVVGGGHAGLLTALVLRRIGLSVALIDPDLPQAVEAAALDGRALALMDGSRRIIDAQGLWHWLRPVAEPILRVLVEDPATGACVTYGAGEAGRRPFGYGIENRLLRRQLLRAVQAEGGTRLLAPARLAGLARDPGRAVARLEDGQSIEARLVVGADGRRSTVRGLAGIAVESAEYGQSALTFAIAHERPHGRMVHERLLPAGPLALLPLAGRTSAVTWIERPDVAAMLLAADPAELVAELRARIGNSLGALELRGRPTAYPLGVLHALRYIAPRVALVGDAAHGVHPIHAQGFNMGVADIGALAAALARAGRQGMDLGGGEALLPYERARRLDNALTVALTDGLARLFTSELLPLRLLRGLGLTALDRLPPLKHLAIRRGMGLAATQRPLAGSTA
jgi:2-octaprenyl-6-methoxyphenol hydroxylase